MNAILNGIGFEKQSKFVLDYLFKTKMRIGIYMSIVVIILEAWMILHTTIMYIEKHITGGFSQYMERISVNYLIPLGLGIVMLIYSKRYVKGKTKNQILGIFIRWIFTIGCVFFGIRMALSNYAEDEQLFSFFTMELFALSLLTLRPYAIFFISALSYVYSFYHIENVSGFNATQVISMDDSHFGIFVMWMSLMWMSTFMVCISSYNVTRIHAIKGEELIEINNRLEKLAVTDELTGIHNMVYFRSEAPKLLEAEDNADGSMIILFFDIENFKSYNEKYGFHEGSIFLRSVAQIINDAFKDSLVSRYNDDHFVVLTRSEGVRNTIVQVSNEINKLRREIYLELKCGGYKPEGDKIDVSLACDRARRACNQIKKYVDRTMLLYDKKFDDKFRMKQYIINSIDTAIANGYIKLFYQPIVSTADGSICGLEALARWDDPNYGMLSPGAFIEVLEEYRLIYKLDKYIIEQACRDYRDAADNKKSFAPVSLNFSRLDFELCDIVGYLCECVEKYNVPKRFMDIEITESAMMDEQDFLPDAIEKLRGLGYKVWLDDFGSGYSSLNVLKDFQFDVMKIDMKFLSGFESNEKARAVLEKIVRLAQRLNMISLTEGVETKEQFEFLGTIGCDRAQGYLFSKPVPIDELRQRIASGSLSISDQIVVE